MHHYYYDLDVFVKTCAVSINIVTLIEICLKLNANHGRPGSGIGIFTLQYR